MIRFKAEVRDSFGSPCRSWCARPKASFLSLFELSKGKESSHEVPLARGPALSHEVPLARRLSMPFDALYSCLFWLFPCSNQIGIENPCKASIDLIEACGLGCCCCCSAVAVVAVCSAVAVAGNLVGLCRGLPRSTARSLRAGLLLSVVAAAVLLLLLLFRCSCGRKFRSICVGASSLPSTRFQAGVPHDIPANSLP